MAGVQCASRPRLQRYLSEGHDPLPGSSPPHLVRRSATISLVAGRKRRASSRRQLLTQQNNNGIESESLKGATQELFDLVVRAQRCRLDDQRCELPPPTTCTPPPSPQSEEDSNRSPVLSGSRALLEATLRGPGPYPMLVLPSSGGYWREGGDLDGPPSPVPETQLETDETASSYRIYFMGKEHYNLLSEDSGLGPALLSVRAEENGSLRLILRLRSGTRHKLITTPPPDLGPAPLARLLSDEVNGNERFTPVVCPKAAEQIVCYDEHALSSTFKFGVVPQQRGQTTEEQLFSNREPSPALLEFLDLLGPRVKLREHKGYRGGLDTQFGQTGEEAVFRLFHGRELMFHVAPLLPYAENDPQQLQRKRHVGNDIVSIVFQEQNTPFAPDMIASHFLHVFLVIQAIEPNTPNVRYRVSVAARESVPRFGPQLPSPAIFSPGPEFQEWLLTKLINAEMAACKAKTFAALQCRTRSALLTALASDLRASTRHFLHEDRTSGSSTPITPPAVVQTTTGSRFMDTVRKALSARPKSNPSLSKTTSDITTAAPTTPTKQHPLSSDCSEVILEETESTSNRSSVRRSLLRHQSAIECSTSSEGDASSLSSAGDTGLESMSSQLVTTPTPSTCSGEMTHRALTDELTQLKTDKLDLQKHNAILQREASTLRDRSAQLESQLAAISAELNKIKCSSETK